MLPIDMPHIANENPRVRRFITQGCEFAVDPVSGKCLSAHTQASDPRSCQVESCVPVETVRLEQQTLRSSDSLYRELSLLRISSDMRVLDVGCGTGALTDLMSLHAKEVVGLDVSPQNLEAAMRNPRMSSRGNVSFTLGDFRSPPPLDGAFDLVVARLLFQHLASPVDDTASMLQLARPGGRLTVIDIDDGMMVDHPEPPTALKRLYDAHVEAQRIIGGDRLVGRKLFSYMVSAGLLNVTLQVLPGFTIVPSVPQIAAQDVAQFIMHFSMLRDHLVDGVGVITSSQFDEAMDAGVEYIGMAGLTHYSQTFIVTGHRP